LLSFITDFADSGTMIPIAIAVVMLLVAFGEFRKALLWCLIVGAVLSIVVVLKLTFAECTPPSPLAAIHSPSGHTVSAVLIYGGLPALLGLGLLSTLALSLLIGAVIGASRVLLHNHSIPEVIIGAGLGLVGTALLAKFWRPAKRHGNHPKLIALAMLALALILHGTHWRTEQVIRHASIHLWPLHACG
jgi:membrane-associated phospholipid phosphatase